MQYNSTSAYQPLGSDNNNVAYQQQVPPQNVQYVPVMVQPTYQQVAYQPPVVMANNSGQFPPPQQPPPQQPYYYTTAQPTVMMMPQQVGIENYGMTELTTFKEQFIYTQASDFFSTYQMVFFIMAILGLFFILFGEIWWFVAFIVGMIAWRKSKGSDNKWIVKKGIALRNVGFVAMIFAILGLFRTLIPFVFFAIQIFMALGRAVVTPPPNKP